MPEYRIEELASASGTTVRTLQSYRTKGLLRPPRRVGRVALYSDDHLERLALIADLISRGYSLNAVGEVLDGFDRGDRIHDLLGLDEEIGQPEADQDQIVTPGDLRAVADDEATLATLVELGMITPIDDGSDGPRGEDGSSPNLTARRYRVDLPGVLEAGTGLLSAGIPLMAILEEGLWVKGEADVIARRFVRLALNHVIEAGAVTADARASSVTELVSRLVPFASKVVAEYVDAALRRQIHLEIESQIGDLLQEDPSEPDSGPT